jgi:DNA-binding IclR family transcriptional regulator
MKFSALTKAIDILNLLLTERDMLTVLDISKSLEMPRSSAYKYLAVLREYGFVDYDKQSRVYKLGFKFLEYASLVQSQIRVDKFALPYMRKLAREVKETVILSVLLNNVAYCLERVEHESGIVFSMQRGTHLTLHSGASAKVLLAFSPDDEIDDFLKNTKLVAYTENTITDPSELKKDLQEIRKKGYAYSDQEVDVGARAVAAPIINSDLHLVAGLCVAGPIHRMKDEKLKNVRKMVVNSAEKISEGLTRQA